MPGTLSLPTLLQRVVLDSSGVEAGAAKAEAGFGRIGRSASSAQGSVERSARSAGASTLALASSAVVAAVGLEKAISAGEAWAGQVFRLQAVTGATAEESSKLNFALQALGISPENAARAFVLLSRNIEQGTDKFKQYFSAAELARLHTGSLTEAIPLLEAKYQSLATTQEKNTFLMNTFGRSGTQMRTLLQLMPADFERLSREAESFGLVLNDKTVKSIRELSIGGNEVKLAFKGLEVQLLAGMIPTLHFMEGVTKGVVEGLNAIPVPIRDAVAVGASAALVFAGLVRVWEGASGVLSKLTGLLGLNAGAEAEEAAAAEAHAAAVTAAAEAQSIANAANLQAIGVLDEEAAAGMLAAGSMEEYASAVAFALTSQAAFGGATQGVVGAEIEETATTLTLAGAMGTLGEAAVGLLSTLGPLALIAAGVGTALYFFHRASQENAKSTEILDANARQMGNSLGLIHLSADKAGAAMQAYNKGLQEAASGGHNTDEQLNNIAGHYELIIAAAKRGGDVAKVTKDIAQGHIAAAQAAASQAAAEKYNAEQTANAGKANADTAAEIKLAIAAQDDLTRSQTLMNAAVDGFGVKSDQAVEAQAKYADAILKSQGFLLDGTDDEKKLADARDKATQQVQKEAQAEQDANDKRIASNLKVIASFDEIKQKGVTSEQDQQKAVLDHKTALDKLNVAEHALAKLRASGKATAEQIATAEDKVATAQQNVAKSEQAVADAGKGALQSFLDATQKNTVTVTNFFKDINTLARAGFQGIARELLAEGPSAEAAAHEAVQRMGSKQGLGSAEQVAEDAIRAAKAKADEGLDTWVPNFQGKGKAAGDALKGAVKLSVDQIGSIVAAGSTIVDAPAIALGLAIQKPIVAAGGTIVRQMQDKVGNLVTIFQTADGQIGIETTDIKTHISSINTLNVDPTHMGITALMRMLGLSRDQASNLRTTLQDIEAVRTIHLDDSQIKQAQSDANTLVDTLTQGGNGIDATVVGVHTHHTGGPVGPFSGGLPVGVIHDGGLIPKRFHFGGLASDEVPAILQTGEFVLKRTAVQALGAGFLSDLNDGRAVSAVNRFASARMEQLLEAILAAVGRRATGDININIPHTDPHVFANELDSLMGTAAMR